MRTARRTRGGSDDFLKPYRVLAALFLVVGVLCLLVEVQSPSLVYWTGERVAATNDGGIIYYTVGGENRTLNDPREPPPHPVPATVYADPDDASRDRPAGLARAVDAVFVLGPFVAAGVLIVVGLVRRRRIRRRNAARPPLSPVRPGRADEPPPSRSTPTR